MRFLTKIIFFLSGISVIGLMLWFGMPNIQQAFKPVEVISVTITLNVLWVSFRLPWNLPWLYKDCLLISFRCPLDFFRFVRMLFGSD